MTARALGMYMDGRHEKEYLVVDVRQPEEYRQGHIPGAKLLPLPELELRIGELPADRDLVFYCHAGGRSAAAALLAAEADVSRKDMYNLVGGFTGWDGRSVRGAPRLRSFDAAGTPAELLMTAMELEKGALLFYSKIFEMHASEPFAGAFEFLSAAETAHAAAVYDFWKKTQTSPPPFEELFEDLKGDILEGGERLDHMLEKAEDLRDNPCLRLTELSLRIEVAAFDLYRTLGDRAEDAAAGDAFLSLAQAEKGHMQTLIKAVSDCGRAEAP